MDVTGSNQPYNSAEDSGRQAKDDASVVWQFPAKCKDPAISQYTSVRLKMIQIFANSGTRTTTTLAILAHGALGS